MIFQTCSAGVEHVKSFKEGGGCYWTGLETLRVQFFESRKRCCCWGKKVEGVDEKVQELVGVCVMPCVGECPPPPPPPPPFPSMVGAAIPLTFHCFASWLSMCGS